MLDFLLKNKSNSYFYMAISSLFLLFQIACKHADPSSINNVSKKKLFTVLPPEESGIHFTNNLEETLEMNYFQYNYTYIGGGVASADFNNDGLVDLFFISNTHENKLYLNKGDLKFEDITAKAGIVKKQGFDAGVTVADVNNDGFVDIYISRGGWTDTDNKFSNLLYLNNGDLTFTEKAEELGIADANRSINAVFFDYDNDNDLDLYVNNTPDMTKKPELVDFKSIQNNPETITRKGSDHLYQNDGTGHFVNVSATAGIVPEIGFGLSTSITDLNNDGWLDIYVCNDFDIPDFIYINNKNGTFSEKREQFVKHMSFNSMGSDMADINNDGLIDLMALDMNPADYIRSKTTMGMTSKDNFTSMVEKGYHYQYMHNMLQLNNGNATFSEISQIAGVPNTDWSWAVLLADFDLDGLNDVYVTNGVFRDVIDKDKNNEILQILRHNKRKPTKEDFLGFAKMLPQQKLSNYFFKNKGDLTFTDVSDEWNDVKPTFSNGAIYADLDNDGDLDLVVNNINEVATVLKNNAIENTQGDFIKLNFKGPEKNTFGIGVIANLYLQNGKKQTRQLINSRGFLSAVSNTLHFGISKKDTLKKIEIIWSDGQKEILKTAKKNQSILISYSKAANEKTNSTEKKHPLFQKTKTNITHIDPIFDDYNEQILLPHKLSQTGPAISKTDINKDGIEDLFIGGGANQACQILISQKNGTFKELKSKDLIADSRYEDVGACFFDADNDGDQDLYVVSGSYEFTHSPRLLVDRLYINNGKGIFSKSLNSIPEIASAGSVVIAADYDNDGDQDLFVGGRVVPSKYPYAPTSYLLLNNNGKFTIETKNLASELEHVGMVTDAVWYDINNDKKLDILVCGEWMGVEVFLNSNGKLTKSTEYPQLSSAKGWWNKLLIADIDNDGDQDIVAGNLGLNYKFHANKDKPFHVYTRDFDYNGTEDIFLAKNYKNKQVPVRGKGCSTQQMPHLKNKIKTYNSFANSDIQGILGNGIKTALHYEVNEFRSGVFMNNQNKSFNFEPFVNEAQTSPINSIIFHDFDKDGYKDLLLAGNNYMSEVETTKADAGIGTYLKGDKNGHLTYKSNRNTGFYADKDVRNMVLINGKSKDYIFIANNNDTQEIYSFEK
ncbi:VCBS repeat-containing protein [Flavicella sediminum]|uniref:VCBS repeat-containing protein n=1 Tax=Flavicella sediminum TaxID=2585141 RepID=UPI001FB76E4F|nr:VCBS repeat-containing protein [Flavicella sediminum]